MESLGNLPNDSSIFIDANIFLYHFCTSEEGIADQCSDFLLKVENGQLKAFTSTFVIAETLHRAMIYEATAQTGLSPKGAMNILRKKPDLIKTLRQYSTIPEKIMEIGIQILIVSAQALLESQSWRDQYGLMVNDSIIIALMVKHGINNLATNDADFDHIRTLNIWKPLL